MSKSGKLPAHEALLVHIETHCMLVPEAGGVDVAWDTAQRVKNQMNLQSLQTACAVLGEIQIDTAVIPDIKVKLIELKKRFPPVAKLIQTTINEL